jgi:subtilisin family serine protease
MMSSIGFGQTKFYTVDNPIPNKYIVVLNKNTYNDNSKLKVQPAALLLANNYNGALGYVYESALKGFSVEMTEQHALSMSQESVVEYVSEDNEMYMNDTQPNAPWNLDRLDQRDLPLNGSYTYNSNGAGVVAYIIDSGINPNHFEFGGINGRAVIGADFVGGNGVDCNGHGTHVAGSVGGTTYGVAKSVSLVAVRVFGCSGSSPSSTIIAGIDWVRGHHAAKSVANMSLGGGANQATDDAVKNLIANGVVAVVAAGNENVDANNSSPARVRQAITVGAIDINDTRASFSNFGNAVDIFAPGVNVTSSWFNGGINVLSGTSMATPHVTGVVAQYLQVALGNQTPAIVQNVIVANASWGKVINRGTGSPNTLLYNVSFPFGDAVQPLFRYFSGSQTDHFYVSDWNEIGAGISGWNVEKIEGYLFKSQNFGTVPLYRYWKPSITDHFYTTNFGELGNGANGYVYEGIIGYVYPSNGVPLYRYWNSSMGDHLYTTDFAEIGNGGSGYVYEGIACYLVQ